MRRIYNVFSQFFAFVVCSEGVDVLLLDLRRHRHHVALDAQPHELVVAVLLLADQVLCLLLAQIKLCVDLVILGVCLQCLLFHFGNLNGKSRYNLNNSFKEVDTYRFLLIVFIEVFNSLSENLFHFHSSVKVLLFQELPFQSMFL